MLTSIYCVIRHEGALERIQEVNSGKSMIGRGDDCVIWLPDPHISREHAEISWNGEQASIRDLGSRNGTHIDNQRMHGEAPIKDGVEVRMGPYLLKVCFEIGNAIRCFVNLEASTRTDMCRGKDIVLAEVKPQNLTPAQERVYDALILGLAEKEVAARLNLSVHTVHTHAKAIYRIFAISSRAELVRRWALQQVKKERPS